MTNYDIKSTFIRKRGNNYNIIIEYINENNESKQKSIAKYSNKKDADKHLIDLKSSINNNKFIVSKDISFVNRYKQYLYDSSKNLSLTTINRRESVLRVNIEPFFRDIKLQDVTPSILQKFLDLMFARYTKSGAEPITGAVKAVFNESYRLREISSNPCDFVKNPPALKKSKALSDPYDKSEVKYIVNKLEGNTIEIPILLMLTMGLRTGEVCGLRWEDIDFKNNTISVKQVLIYTKGNKISFKEPKTDSSIRTISAPEELISKLKKLKIRHNELLLTNSMKKEYRNIVCLNTSFTPYIPAVLRESWKRFSIKNDIRYIRMHDLRHTHATMLVLAGVDFKTISNRLGHTDIKITLNRYSHVLKEMDLKASENISNIMFK